MTRIPLLAIPLALCACRSSAPSVALDPAQGEVPLTSASPEWNAYLLRDTDGVGVWTVKAFDVFPQYASPEIVALDDAGVCHVLVSYSGKWTPFPRVHDGSWLGGLDHGDVDPRVAGGELYTGSESGNLYQLVAYEHGALDARWIARFDGREVHTVLACDLDPQVPGGDVLVFTSPGALYRVTPTGPDGTFERRALGEHSGRIRDALLLPRRAGAPPEIATAGRNGELSILTFESGEPRWRVVFETPMGLGRLALRPSAGDGRTVLYSTLDDGRVMRHERSGDAWTTETIYLGPQGPRGVAAGRFDVDPDVETVAVFGYGERVELLSRRGDSWDVETLFVDAERGHWLTAVELDGRNATHELVGSGYSGRVFMLARPPGAGRPGIATQR